MAFSIALECFKEPKRADYPKAYREGDRDFWLQYSYSFRLYWGELELELGWRTHGWILWHVISTVVCQETWGKEEWHSGRWRMIPQIQPRGRLMEGQGVDEGWSKTTENM